MFETIARQVALLGGVSAGTRFLAAQLEDIETAAGAPIPPSLRWWWMTVGGGNQFLAPVVYDDPRTRVEVVLAWFLDAAGVVAAIVDDPIVPRRFPFHADEMDNLIVVDRDGSVWEHLHDAPLDRRSERIAASFETFVLSLRTPTD